MFHAHDIKGDFKPLQDWVILHPVLEDPEKGGILLPEDARQYGRCEVVAVGPGRRTSLGALCPTELKVGQFVYLQKFVEGEMKFRLNGKVVFASRERHLNLTIENAPEAVDSGSKKAKK